MQKFKVLRQIEMVYWAREKGENLNYLKKI